MALGRRCDLGCESWPDQALYAKCLTCDEPTKRYDNLQPLSVEEAQSILAHHEFEKFYARREAAREASEGSLELSASTTKPDWGYDSNYDPLG